MIGCLVLYHPTITVLTKSKILRMMFHTFDFSIQVGGKQTVTIFIKDIEKENIWQAAALFGSTNILTGYGFGTSNIEAEKEAWHIILKLIEES
ncbi:MAG TPA: hypothetical protein VIG73_10820 [Cerasibacillus sp.]|uniref:hypothetical protein n=1 Tax=Cerasibacillus sp. TaxID=2498711 RepID=UPI002F40DBE7